MSYDFRIAADQHYSQSTDLGAIRDYIQRLPDITATSSRHCRFQDVTGHYYMEIDLEAVDGNGNSLADQQAEHVNCIRCHIPYAFYPATVDTVYNHLILIAEFLEWRLYDEQTGAYWE